MTSRKGLWIALGAGAFVPLCAVAIVLEARLSADAHLRRERDRVAREFALLHSRGEHRPRFFEPAEEGNSWELLKGELEDLAVVRRGLSRSWTEPRYEYTIEEEFSFDPIMNGYGLCPEAERSPGEGELDRGIELLAACWGLADRLAVNQDLQRLWDHFTWQVRGLEALEEILRMHDLSKAQLQRLARLLELMETHPPNLREAFRISDLKARRDLFKALEKLEESPLADQLKPKLGDLYSSKIAASKLLRLRDAYQAGLEERLMLEGEARWLAVDAWVTRCFEDLGDPLYDRIRTPVTELFRMEAKASVHLQLARVTVAIARGIKDWGSMPTNLEALVPAYLKDVPMDPHLGNPLRYKCDDLDGLVYALGWDKDDDGGKPMNAYGNGDFVWTVRRR